MATQVTCDECGAVIEPGDRCAIVEFSQEVEGKRYFTHQEWCEPCAEKLPVTRQALQKRPEWEEWRTVTFDVHVHDWFPV